MDGAVTNITKVLQWNKRPELVLVVKRFYSQSVISPFIELIHWLILEQKMTVYIEENVINDDSLMECFFDVKHLIKSLSSKLDCEKIEFVITLGGDGTLIHAIWLFQKKVPPVLAFHFGSLGFLTPFHFQNYKECITKVVEGAAPILLRSRLYCSLERKNKKTETFNVVNEVYIRRHADPYSPTTIDLFMNGELITHIEGDGLIISTPTGSTAYSASTGASVIHPSVSAILVCPISPSKITFRPILVPPNTLITIAISPNSLENNAWVVFDGVKSLEISYGDNITISISSYPLPSICAQNQTADWFQSLRSCMSWNS